MKYFYHKETDPMTKREYAYSCERRELSTAHTLSSYICFEIDRGSQIHKVRSGKFVAFARICFFVEHCAKNNFAYLKWIRDVQYDNETGLWFTKLGSEKDTLQKSKHSFQLTKNMSHPLVTAIENGCLWFLNSGKFPYLPCC